MEFEQLMITDDGNLATVEEQQFKKLHCEIMNCGNMTCEYFLEMAKRLKEMKDSNLYTAAGFESFGEYTSKAVGIKERQAYNYIAIAEKNSPEFLQLNAKLGVSKLALITNLSETQKENIVAAEDIESITVKELKARIEELTQKNEQYSLDIEQLMKDADDVQQKIDNATTDALKSADKTIQRLNDEIKKESDKREKEKQEAIKKIEEKQAEIEKLKKDIQNSTKEEVVPNVEMQEELASSKERIRELNKKLATAAPEVLAFKIRFEMWQKDSLDLIEMAKGLEEDKYVKAIKTVVERWAL